MEVNKRHYIYNNIDNLKIHNKIIDFIKYTNVKYTENKNGIFLNLTMLDGTIIDDIFFHFTNNTKKEQPVYEPKKTDKTQKIPTKINKVLKDKLVLEKFDKYILQASRGDIYI